MITKINNFLNMFISKYYNYKVSKHHTIEKRGLFGKINYYLHISMIYMALCALAILIVFTPITMSWIILTNQTIFIELNNVTQAIPMLHLLITMIILWFTSILTILPCILSIKMLKITNITFKNSLLVLLIIIPIFIILRIFSTQYAFINISVLTIIQISIPFWPLMQVIKNKENDSKYLEQ